MLRLRAGNAGKWSRGSISLLLKVSVKHYTISAFMMADLTRFFLQVQPARKPEKCPQHEVKQELVKELSLGN